VPVRPRCLAAAAALALLALLPAGTLAMDAATPDTPTCLERRDAPPGLLGPSTDEHAFGLEGCTGALRPGALMTAPAGCTLNFVFRDGGGAFYIGTAGHCVSSVGQRVSASGVGPFGSVVYRRLQGVNDFALIKIDADKSALVNPTMCTWGGPIGPDEAPVGTKRDLLLEYGWGIATQFTSASRSRAHAEFQVFATHVTWNGVGSGGDSGAPVVDQAGRAVAIHTFGQTPFAGVVLEGGPSFANILAMGRTAVPSLELVTGHPSSVEAALGKILS
jgi:hypothetical protein